MILGEDSTPVGVVGVGARDESAEEDAVLNPLVGMESLRFCSYEGADSGRFIVANDGFRPNISFIIRLKCKVGVQLVVSSCVRRWTVYRWDKHGCSDKRKDEEKIVDE